MKNRPNRGMPLSQPELASANTKSLRRNPSLGTRHLDHLGFEVSDGVGAQKSHRHLDLLLHDLQRLAHTGGTVGGLGVQDWPPKTYSARAKAECFDNVGPSTNASINVDFDSVQKGWVLLPHFDQDVYRRSCAIELPSSVGALRETSGSDAKSLRQWRSRQRAVE